MADVPAVKPPWKVRFKAFLRRQIEFLQTYVHIWSEVLAKPIVQSIIQLILLHPAYLSFFSVFVVYILGYFGGHILWCIVAIIFVNYLASVLLKETIIQAIRRDEEIGNSRAQAFLDKESATWINNIIAAIYINHHNYLSQLVLQILNPILHQIFAIPPISSVKFANLDIGVVPLTIANCSVINDQNKNPPEILKFDLDVDYASDLKATVELGIHKFTIPIHVSNLVLKSRIRMEVMFMQDKFPFISYLRISLLEQPELDISVVPSKTFDLLTIPFVKEHYVELVTQYLFSSLGAPKFIEVNFANLIYNYGDAGESLAQDVKILLGEAIRQWQAPPPQAEEGVVSGLFNRFVRKIRKPAAEPKVEKEKKSAIRNISQIKQRRAVEQQRTAPASSNNNLPGSQVRPLEVKPKYKLQAGVGFNKVDLKKEERLTTSSGTVPQVPRLVTRPDPTPSAIPKVTSEGNAGLTQSGVQLPPSKPRLSVPQLKRLRSHSWDQNALSELVQGTPLNKNPVHI